MESLPVELFIKEITYLPFTDVQSLCSSNKKLHSYCTDEKYKNYWKALIDNTFSNIDNYYEKLNDIRQKLNISDQGYNYFVYVHMIELLDPITQLMIYYKQGDMKSFNDSKYDYNRFDAKNAKRYLALFLLAHDSPNLNQRNDSSNLERNYYIDEMRKYLPPEYYSPFIDFLIQSPVSPKILRNMASEMVRHGSLKGLKIFIKYSDINWILDEAKDLDIIKYLFVINPELTGSSRLPWAAENNQFEIVKFLVENGADVNDLDGEVLLGAIRYKNWNIVKYLLDHGADVNLSLPEASASDSYDAVKYLVEHGATNINEALVSAAINNRPNIVKYLVDQGADVNYQNGEALVGAVMNGNIEILKYLVEQGADVNHQNGEVLNIAVNIDDFPLLVYLVTNGANIDSLNRVITFANTRMKKYLENAMYNLQFK